MSSLKIFVIDDDPIFLNSIKEKFSKLSNYTFFYFNSGEQALLEAYKKPDLVFVDYYLDSKFPDAENGFRIINSFKVLLPNSKLTLISSSTNVNLINEIKALANVNYIHKNTNVYNEIKQVILEYKPAKNTNFFKRFFN
ncbi:MAG: response regulator [Bacteroidetes bacterium]|nr:response regulator [Bacteroidota bacterium]